MFPRRSSALFSSDLLGGRLDLGANFTDHTLTVTSTEAA
jgi:hypothetical protein